MYIPIYNRFIGGSSISHAINACKNRGKGRWLPIFDMAKESNTMSNVQKDIRRIYRDFETIKESNVKGFYAFKYSTFGSAHIKSIHSLIARANEIGLDVLVDAESSKYTRAEDECIDSIIKDGGQIFKTYQLYRKDGLTRLIYDLDKGHVKRIKLVRGAYMKQEIDQDVLLPDKKHVDHAYDCAVKYLLSQMTVEKEIKLMIATHNVHSVNKAMQYIQHEDVKGRVYFAQLFGMGDTITDNVINHGFHGCKYIPYGTFSDTFPYLSRRLYENAPLLTHVFS